MLDRSVLGRSVDDPATSTQVMPASAFRAYTVGDSIDQIVPRNSMVGDGLDNVDLGFYKNFRFTRSQSFSVRLEVYNLFDTVQYAFPAAVLTGTNFGVIQTTHAVYLPRTVQIAFRYRF